VEGKTERGQAKLDVKEHVSRSVLSILEHPQTGNFFKDILSYTTVSALMPSENWTLPGVTTCDEI